MRDDDHKFNLIMKIGTGYKAFSAGGDLKYMNSIKSY